MAREADLHGVIGDRLTVPPGATLAVFVNEIGGAAATILKYFSGGSLEIFQAPNGGLSFPTGATQWAAASLAALSGTGYLFGTTESVSIDGSCRYYLMANTATTIVMRLTGLSSGW